MTSSAAEAMAGLESSLIDLYPVVTDIVATVLDNPAMDMDRYAELLEAAESHGGLLFVALVRVTAGLAHTLDMTPDQVRGLGQLDPTTTG